MTANHDWKHGPRYACLARTEAPFRTMSPHFRTVGGIGEILTRAEAVAFADSRRDTDVVRVLPDGAHEAAIQAAAAAERERCAREFCEAMGAHPSGSWDGVLDVARLLKAVCEKTIERREEAAKGQAK